MVHVVPKQVGRDPNTIVRTLLKPTQVRSEPVQLGSLQATRFVGVRQNTQGQQQPVEATVVNGPGDHSYLLRSKPAMPQPCSAPALRCARPRAVFSTMTAQDRSAARAWVMKPVAYPQGGFAELAKTSPLETPEQQLRLLNGFYAGGEPKAGQMVKVIGVQ